MAIINKQVRAYLQSLIEAFKIENNQKPADPEVLAFVEWLLPIEEERQVEYRQAFKAILGDDPLWIICMQCEYDGIFYDHVSEPRPTLLRYADQETLFGVFDKRYLTLSKEMPEFVPGERILIGKCSNCGITEHLHIPVVMHALEKRKKVTGALDIPRYILAEAGL